MNSPQNQGLPTPFEDPEVEIYRPRPMRPDESGSDTVPSISSGFASLSGGGKILIVLLMGVIALATVGVVLQLLVWSIQLIGLGIVLFLAYRIFWPSRTG